MYFVQACRRNKSFMSLVNFWALVQNYWDFPTPLKCTAVKILCCSISFSQNPIALHACTRVVPQLNLHCYQAILCTLFQPEAQQMVAYSETTTGKPLGWLALQMWFPQLAFSLNALDKLLPLSNYYWKATNPLPHKSQTKSALAGIEIVKYTFTNINYKLLSTQKTNWPTTGRDNKLNLHLNLMDLNWKIKTLLKYHENKMRRTEQ